MDRRVVVNQLAEQYRATRMAAAAVLAGSLGRGRADRFSDVELDIYWKSPPSDAQRRAPATALGGVVTTLWPYDADDAEWSEDVRVLGVDVTVSGFVCDQIDQWIATLGRADGPQLVRQLRMSALHEGHVLFGADRIGGWRARAGYPPGLAVATAASFLTPQRLSRWRLRNALAERGDLLMLHRACSEVSEAMVGALCAVNRIYLEHPSFKWSRQLVARFDRAPVDFADRLFSSLARGALDCAAGLDPLLLETVQLVASDLPEVDLSGIEPVLRAER